MDIAPTVSIKNSISTQLLKTVFSMYIVLTIIVTVTHMTVEFYSTKDEVSVDLGVILNNFLPVIDRALWDMNLEQLQPTVEALERFPAVVGVKLENDRGETLGLIGTIREEDGKILNVSKDGSQTELKGFEGVFHISVPIIHQYRQKKIQTGMIHLYSSTIVVLDKVKWGYVLIVFNSIIKTGAFWILFLWISRLMLGRPLATLTHATEQVHLDQLSDFRVHVPTKGINELKVLEESFNSMLQKLSGTYTKVEKMTYTFQKFVPHQFLSRIAVEGIENIELGKAEQDSITILFSDIRAFTDLSETLSPQELLDFLNEYLQQMNEPIHQNEGFVDKFIGDAINVFTPTLVRTKEQEDLFKWCALLLNNDMSLFKLSSFIVPMRMCGN